MPRASKYQYSPPIPLETYGQLQVRDSRNPDGSSKLHYLPRSSHFNSMNETTSRTNGCMQSISDTYEAADHMERGEAKRSRKCLRLNAAFWINISAITLVGVVIAVMLPSILKNPNFFKPAGS